MSCKKTHDFIALRVFSNIGAASLPQNVYYRVIAVREGGHALETRPASSEDEFYKKCGYNVILQVHGQNIFQKIL